MKAPFERVAAWNSKRYDQVYDKSLSMSLLQEEFTELLEADARVDMVDALCDIQFVAIGVLWKAKTLEGALEDAIPAVSIRIERLVDTGLPPALFIATLLLAYEADCGTLTDLMLDIILLAYAHFQWMGLTEEQAERCFMIVCDSNDSKSVKKTASDVKANDGDKGPYFQTPEPRLQAVLNERHH